MKKRHVLQTLITTGSYKDFVEEVFRLAASKYSSYVCFSNVHMLIEAYKDPEFNQIVNQADMATPDGVPLRIAMRLKYGIQQDRIAGMDAFPHLLKEAARRGKSIYLYGGKQEVLEAIVSRVEKEIPNLKIAGYYSPPFRALSDIEKQEIRNRINNSQADMTFVALGCPKQERWVAAEQGKIKGCLLAVGGAFTVYAGMQTRAPKWMQKYSLEWLFRLVQEPKRLFKRYFVTNSLFLYLFMKDLFLGKRNYSQQLTQKA